MLDSDNFVDSQTGNTFAAYTVHTNNVRTHKKGSNVRGNRCNLQKSVSQEAAKNKTFFL